MFLLADFPQDLSCCHTVAACGIFHSLSQGHKIFWTGFLLRDSRRFARFLMRPTFFLLRFLLDPIEADLQHNVSCVDFEVFAGSSPTSGRAMSASVITPYTGDSTEIT